MGVPKFYRWISERYPCLSEVVKEFQIPDFDNLYLDMNGIIHTCSHPNDDDPHFRITEAKIFAGICHYIDFLFKMIKPKKVFFMAVDGVAPRAKMNQQRGRRFRTAKTAILLEERAKALGENLPNEARFDSNCITPGTEFMARLHDVLQGFVIHKISTDPLWRGIRVYLSGHETPGEGEHKIMDFIRYEKSQPGYNPNTRHCLYGLDADLIMLGLCSHEPYFSLLREEVKFGGRKNQKRIMTPEETTFHLLHISLLRDYLYHEFSPVKDRILFDFNVENIVDDFVLMSFLVGNDFIPHLPQLHIHHDALPVLFQTYIDVLPSLDGYINEQGSLNLSRFETFLKKLSEYDFQKFGELNDDFQYLESKSKTKTDKEHGSEKMSTSDILSDLGFSSLAISKMAEFDSSSDADDDEDDEKGDSSDEDDDGCSLLEQEFNMHKTDYYMNKLEFAEVTPEVLKDQAEGYVRAIQWNLHYYYNGVMSWSWYYPHHYSPYISDVKDFKNMEMNFELGKPFLPFQQLLAVLPKLSKDLLPESYQKLMCDKDSPLIDYYPDDFETDLNGKQQEWEAIVLIPFINEKLLLKFAAIADKELTEEERKRNTHGPHLLYTYESVSSGIRPSFLPPYYPPLKDTYFKLVKIDKDFFRIPENEIYKGLCKGIILDKIILGFPTLQTLKHTAKLKNEKVKVFQMLSQKENMMLTIKSNKETDLKKIAEQIVGQIIYVGWPHLREAFVVAVSDGKHQILYDKSKSASKKIALVEKEMTSDEESIWMKQAESVQEHNYQRWGIFIGSVYILVHAKCLSGIRYVLSREGKLDEEKQWEGIFCNFALQATIFNTDAFLPDVSNVKNSMDIFSPGSVVFILVSPYYGSMGTVLGFESEKCDAFITVDIVVTAEPDLQPVILNKDEFITDLYKPGYVAAQQLGIESYFMSRLAGTFLIQTSPKGSSNPNRANIGLNLKFSRKNEEVLGFTKRKDNTWLYSEKAIKLLDTYLSEFPSFFEKLSKFVKNDVIYLEDLYPNGEGQEFITKITDWLKSQCSALAERQKCGMRKLDSGIISEIEQRVQSEVNNEICHITECFEPHQLYSPYMCKGLTKPDPTASFNLFDRVVNVNHSSCVPLGLRGTVIGIGPDDNEAERMYEIVFDKEFFGGLALSCSPGKGYRLLAHSLINITHGHKKIQKQFHSPIKNAKNVIPRLNRSGVFDAAVKQLQSDIPSVQVLQKKHPQSSPGSNKPFYNVNEMFQTKNVASQNKMFSTNLSESSNKQFVTPKAGYISNAPYGGIMSKKDSTYNSATNYQNLWADLKKSGSESHSYKASNESTYGQKLSVEELFQSADVQKDQVHNKNNIQRHLSDATVTHRSYVEMLLQLCISNFNAPPIYTYHNYGNTHLFIATISLPNGNKVTGGPCEQKYDAAALAAEKAVANLKSVAFSSINMNDLPSLVQSNRMQKDASLFVRPPQIRTNEYRPPLLIPNTVFEMPLMRHPSPVHSTRMPDSFVTSNRVLLNHQAQSSSLSSPASRYSSIVPESDLFHLPGGGVARIKNTVKSHPVKLSNENSMFVPAQVMKQALKPPFDSSGTSNSEWPDLPSKTDNQVNVVQSAQNIENGRTASNSQVSKPQNSPSTVKTPISHTSTMTVLTKKPKRRLAANFQNP